MHLVGGFEYGAIDSLRHDVYDTEAQSWGVAAPLPEPSHHVVGAEIGGKLLVVGGLQTLQFVPTGHLWEFDPATAMWTARASLPAARVRGAGAAVAHRGRLYYVGGLQDNGATAVALADVYDPATDSWTSLPDMPTPRDHLGLAVVGERLYAVGGRAAAFDTEVDATQAFDLATGKWSGGLAPLPTLRAGFATAVVDGEIVTIGGESAKGPHDEVEGYDPATNLWRTLAPVPLPRHGIQGVGFAGAEWIAGGGTDTLVAATASLDVFYPGPRPAPALPPLPAAPMAPAARGPSTASLRMSVRRRGRRIVVVLRGPVGVRVALAVRPRARARRGRTLARRSVTLRRSPQSAVLRLRRPARRGTLIVEARAGSTLIRRRA